MNKASLKQIGRWIAVIPVAVIGFFLGGILANLFFIMQGWFIGVDPDSGWGKINFYVLSSAVSGISTVYFGAKVAPGHRKIVSMVLAAIVVAVSTLAALGAYYDGDHFFWSVLASLACVIAAGSIVYCFFKEGDDFSLFD